MGVRDEEVQVDRTVPELAHEGQSQPPQAGAGVEHNDHIVDSDFDARGVAAVMDGVAARGGNRAAHAPDFEAGAAALAGGGAGLEAGLAFAGAGDAGQELVEKMIIEGFGEILVHPAFQGVVSLRPIGHAGGNDDRARTRQV